jgi:hypothetical protein
MSEEIIGHTSLWRSGFSQAGDGRDAGRRELEQALLTFRRRTAQLLSLISGDMRNYTVHDIDHIDALWEMGEIIAGPNYALNPAEAFVFGGSLLLHDAGMTVAAYPDGDKLLMETPQWKDNLSSAKRVFAVSEDATDEKLLKNRDIFSFVTAATLRDLHAAKAESLIRDTWVDPVTGESQFLLDHTEFRSFYGESIGIIASSHHWDVSRVTSDLAIPLGSFPGHPAGWTVDRIKVALLLRCSDAAHIDARRAPRLLFALTRPTGVSFVHWNFQTKLTKPRAEHGKLVYTSSSAFGPSESESWQLAWDTIRMIDFELESAAEILVQRQLPSFAVSGAEGAQSPLAFAQFVRARGWRPVLAELKVSDVAHLAQTLGGRGLYSHGFAPLRELIQNAADAIDARRAIDREFDPDDGRITVRVLEDSPDVPNEILIIEVEDNGLGMSERILTGPLIDFGKSFWKSSLARSEYPGLQGRMHEPRGRFGIGFFSVFMWANEVSIASRPYAAGRADTKVLQFRAGLGQRPILRDALASEVLGSSSTRVRLTVPQEAASRIFGNEKDPGGNYDIRSGVIQRPIVSRSWNELVALISGLLDIKVYIEYKGTRTLVNILDWRTVSNERFVDFFKCLDTTEALEDPKPQARQLREVHSKNGELIGRAMLMRRPARRSYYSPPYCVYERGIFVTIARIREIFGATEGSVTRATRESANFLRPSHDLVHRIRRMVKAHPVVPGSSTSRAGG